MSEPIQSIAQNNYILATQQEVSHDNTLSGNGTVDSPLGLNETELWYSETFGASDITLGSKFTLSEPTTAFEEVKIYWTRNAGTQSIAYTYPTRFWNDTYCTHYDGFMSFYAGSNYMRGNTIITSTNFKDWYVASGFQTNENSTSLSTAKGYIKPYKVIGINRLSASN